MSIWMLVLVIYVEDSGKFSTPFEIQKVAIYKNLDNCKSAASILQSGITPRANSICVPIEDIKTVIPNF